jgi:hypothetical protein
MKWNPFINALGAVAYVGGVATFLHFIYSIRHDTPDTLLDSMAFLSLFVFSAAVMAFLFFYHPTVLVIENKKAEAVSYFLKTLGLFGAITILVVALMSLQ